MAKPKKTILGRRGFLKGAAALVASAQGASAQTVLRTIDVLIHPDK
jgi:hypothetical protein